MLFCVKQDRCNQELNLGVVVYKENMHYYGETIVIKIANIEYEYYYFFRENKYREHEIIKINNNCDNQFYDILYHIGNSIKFIFGSTKSIYEWKNNFYTFYVRRGDINKYFHGSCFIQYNSQANIFGKYNFGKYNFMM